MHFTANDAFHRIVRFKSIAVTAIPFESSQVFLASTGAGMLSNLISRDKKS